MDNIIENIYLKNNFPENLYKLVKAEYNDIKKKTLNYFQKIKKNTNY